MFRTVLHELVHTTLNTTTSAFDGTVKRFINKPSNFIKGPWVSVDMPFRQIDVNSDGTWTEPFPDIPLGFIPYHHQIQVFDRLAGETLHSTLIATGTGSGKTESYLWPILEYCRQNRDKPGIKAILIYPMNALATDQARRIAKTISGNKAINGVRAGIYADAKPKDPVYKVTKDNIITSRETLQKNPPDILLTNYKMLDYLLLRGDDKPLWEKNNPETLRFLVVDELHTFDGAQGADLALLLRRVKHRLNTPENHLVCIGSSATLGSGEDARPELREYAEQIFGESFDDQAIITETRKTPDEVFDTPKYTEMPPDPNRISNALHDAQEISHGNNHHEHSTAQSETALLLAKTLFQDRNDPALAFIDEDNPFEKQWRIALGEQLKKHYLCQQMMKIIAGHEGPASFEVMAEGLEKIPGLDHWQTKDLQALAEILVSLVSWSRAGSSENLRPLFNVRLQLWVREMSRIVANLPENRSNGKHPGIDLFHALDLDGESLENKLPIINCNRCGTTAHVGLIGHNSNKCWAPLDKIYEDFFGDTKNDRVRLFYHDPIEMIASKKGKGRKIIKGLLDAETVEFTASEDDNAQSGASSQVWMYNPHNAKGDIDRTCPSCGQAQGLVIFGVRSARLTDAVSRTLYSSVQNEEYIEEIPSQNSNPEETPRIQKPRLLMFSDSVQDAAHRASIAEMRNTLAVSQKSLFKVLNKQEHDDITLHDVIENVPGDQLGEHGPDEFTSLFIPKTQTWRKTYRDHG